MPVGFEFQSLDPDESFSTFTTNVCDPIVTFDNITKLGGSFVHDASDLTADATCVPSKVIVPLSSIAYSNV